MRRRLLAAIPILAVALVAAKRSGTNSGALLRGFGALLFCVSAVACDDGVDPAETNSQPQAARLPPNTYVPLVDASSPNRGSVHFASWLWHNDVRSSFVLVVTNPVARYGALRLAIACAEGELSVYLAGIPDVGGGEVEVELRMDLDERHTQSWQGDGVLGLSLGGEPARAMYEKLRGAELLELAIPEIQLGPTSIPIGELSRTPIIDNLDYCGDYHPTERRVVEPDYEPVVDLAGTAGPHLTYESIEETFGSRTILTTTVRLASYTKDETASEVELVLFCSDSGRIGILLEGLPDDTPSGPIAVALTMDDAMTTTDDWWFLNQGERVTGDAEGFSLLPALLLADHMSLSIPRLGIGPLDFDLRGMFETPVQGNIDQCGHYAES